MQPEAAKEAFRMGMAAQRSDGYIPQGFKADPYGKLIQLLVKDFRDAPAWAPVFAKTILEVTGDTGLFSERIPYADGKAGTVYEHLMWAMEFLNRIRGEHGLVLIGGGDWNDKLDAVGLQGRGEPVWLTMHDILGLRGTPGGLAIRPKFPAAWTQAACHILFRVKRLNLSRGGGVAKGHPPHPGQQT